MWVVPIAASYSAICGARATQSVRHRMSGKLRRRDRTPGRSWRSWNSLWRFSWYTLWLFNIAIEHGPFIDDFPTKTTTYRGFSMAMLNNQMVRFYGKYGWCIVDLPTSNGDLPTNKWDLPSGVMKHGELGNPICRWRSLAGKIIDKKVAFPASHVWLLEGKMQVSWWLIFTNNEFNIKQY